MSGRIGVSWLAALLLGACAPLHVDGPAVRRSDLRIESEPGLQIAAREVLPPAGVPRRVPVVLVHGAGAAGVAAFDLPVPGYSLAEDLARAGHPAYALDVRGWGHSTRPASLEGAAGAAPPAVPSRQAARDIAAVVEHLRAQGYARVAVLGWASGGHWAGLYAATHPGAVSHLVLLNALYGVDAPWPLRARLEDEGRPGVLAASLGAYTYRDARSLLGAWDANIPVADKASWRDPRVAAAYVDLTLAADPTANTRQPPSARIPAGALADSYAVSKGMREWQAQDVRAATLVVRSALDFWSRREDVQALQRELVSAARVEVLELPDATHLVFLDRPEHGRTRFVQALLRFLADAAPAAR